MKNAPVVGCVSTETNGTPLRCKPPDNRCDAHFLGKGQQALAIGLHAAGADGDQAEPALGSVFEGEADALTGDDPDRSAGHGHIDHHQHGFPAANGDTAGNDRFTCGKLGRRIDRWRWVS